MLRLGRVAGVRRRVRQPQQARAMAGNVKSRLQETRLLVTSKSWCARKGQLYTCPMCRQAKKLLDSLGAQYQVWEIDGLPEESQIQDEFAQISGARTVPRIAIDGEVIGGADELTQMYNEGKLIPMLKEKGLTSG